jgi:2-keto-3-deoxy-L-rhamnonate aldolase RhmA
MMKWLKDKLEAKPLLHGIWLSTGSHAAAEIAVEAGFDWALLDLEHGLGGEQELLRALQVMSRTDTTPVVRVPSSESDLVKKALDFGASAVMAPMINTASEAERFVRAMRYPPLGVRGLTASSRAASYGYDFKEYFRQANTRVCGIAQIETGRAVEQADAIAAVDGIDVLFIGHSDLSLELGCFGDYDSPLMRAAEGAVLDACARHGKKAGMLLKSGMSAEACQQKGFSFLALGSEIGCLRQGFDQLIKTARRTP